MWASRQLPATGPRQPASWTCAQRTIPSSRATDRPLLTPRDTQAGGERLLVFRLAEIGRKLDGEARTLEHGDELRRPTRTREPRLEGDDATLNQIGERLLHCLHAAAGVRLHHRIDLLDLALADEVPDRVVRQQDLECGNASQSVRGR